MTVLFRKLSEPRGAHDQDHALLVLYPAGVPVVADVEHHPVAGKLTVVREVTANHRGHLDPGLLVGDSEGDDGVVAKDRTAKLYFDFSDEGGHSSFLASSRILC